MQPIEQIFYAGIILIITAAVSITFAVFGKKGARLESEIYNFTPKFQNATKNNILSGITFFAWVSILWRRLYDIDFITYWRRIVFITFMSILNSMLKLLNTSFENPQSSAQGSCTSNLVQEVNFWSVTLSMTS